MNQLESSSTSWIEIGVEVDPEAVEPVVELFSQYGYNHGVAIDEPFTQDPDGDNLAVDTSRPVLVRTFLPAGMFTAATKQDIEQALWYLGQMRPIGPLSITTHQEEDWEHSWKQHFTPVRASNQVVVRPPWHDYRPSAKDIVVILDPGMAFGTGTHPTTRLALELLEDWLTPGGIVLDAGTGTGVLAIAARLFGAGHVDAVDIDPVAVKQSTKNVELNGQTGGIRVWQDALGRPPRERYYDLVVANIISRVLIEVQPALVSAMKDDASLMLSGIIESKEHSVVESYRGSGLELIERRQRGDWIAHVWQRRAAD